MTHTIISKRLNTFTYQQWQFANGQYIPVGPGVLINGGAGVIGGNELLSGIPLEKRSKYAPAGVLTFVDDETLAYLMGSSKFQEDLERGIITVVKGKVSQEKGEDIASRDMLEDENITERPYSEKDIVDAGGVINRDGSVDITDAAEDIDVIRKQNAGQTFYNKKRMAEERSSKRRGRPKKTA